MEGSEEEVKEVEVSRGLMRCVFTPGEDTQVRECLCVCVFCTARAEHVFWGLTDRT